MTRYAVAIEKGRRNLGAWVPDLPGCVSVGGTLPEMRRMIREAIEFHIDGMREDGDPIPGPTSTCAVVGVGKDRYAVLVERRGRGFAAQALDIPGCVAAGPTRREALLLLEEVLDRRFQDLKWEGKALPAPSELCEMIEVRPAPDGHSTFRAASKGGGRSPGGGRLAHPDPRRDGRGPRARRRRRGVPVRG